MASKSSVGLASVPYHNPPRQDYSGMSQFESASNAAQASVDRFTNKFESALSGLDDIARRIADISLDAPTPFSPPASPDIPTAPNLEIAHELPALSERAQMGDFTLPGTFTLPDLNIPDLSEAANVDSITPNFPGAPSVTPPSTSIDVPTIDPFSSPITISSPPPMTGLTIPAVPAQTNYTLNLPSAPDVSSYIQPVPVVPSPNLPTLPSDFWDVPTFTGTFPSIPTPPAFTFTAFTLDQFVSVIKPQVEAAISQMLTTAALDPTYEQASLDAVMSREVEVSNATFDKVQEQWADSGFAMPPGMMFEMDTKIRGDIERKSRVASREIYKTRKELELQVRTAALQAGTQMVATDAQIYQITSSALLESFKFNEGQVLRSYELALKAADIIGEQVKIEADVFRAQLDGIRAKWQGYTSLTQAEVARIDAVKAQISAIASGAEIGKSIVGMYTAQVNAESTVAKLYFDRDRLLFDSWKAQVDVQVEQLKANAVYGDIIRAQASVIDAHARAYQAEVQGKISAAQLQGTVAQVQADIQKLYVAVYESAVRGEAARVDALAKLAATKVGIYKEQATFAIAKANAVAQKYSSESSINAARINAAAAAYQARANSEASSYNAEAAMMNAHASLVNAMGTKNQAISAAYKAQVETLVLAYKAKVDTANAWYSRTLNVWSQVINKTLTSLQGLMSKQAAAAQVAGQVASSALQGTFVSLQVSQQKSDAQVQNWSYNLSNNLNESHGVTF